jgi:3-keto-5-aminohexanoate cleavage enzyme
MSRLIITVALCGLATSKKMNPYVPITPEEIAADVVSCAKAGASIAHIHARDLEGRNTLDVDVFKEVCDRVREACAMAGVDIVLNLTTNGGRLPDELRMAHLPICLPEMCTFDPCIGNSASTPGFIDDVPFPEKLGALAREYNIKPEVEIFDGGMMHTLNYHIQKGTLRTPLHVQFVLGSLGTMPGNLSSLAYLLPQLPHGSTWSISGIGKTHMPMMLAGLAAGCTGLRVGLEDSLYLARGVYATNTQLVERAVNLAKAAGREIATAQEAREILGLTKKINF